MNSESKKDASAGCMERLVLDLFVSDTISTLQYWRDISECDCSSPLPQGGCLRCDLDKILLLGAERRSEPEVAHPLPPVAILCRTLMCWHPLARKPQRSKKMSDTPTPKEAAESGLSRHDLLAVLEPVLDWYQSDERDPREPLDILSDIVDDIQTDRTENIRLRSAAKRALKLARNGRYSAAELIDVANAFDDLDSILANSQDH